MRIMDMQLAGQVVVVAGAAQGIGRAIAAAFAQEGTKVALLDVAAGMEGLAAQWEAQHHARMLGLQVDATDYAAVQAAAATIASELGACRHVVYAAGMGSGKFGFPFWNLEPGDWERVWKVNLLGAVHFAHAFAPGLAQQQAGSMTFVSSVAGQIGSQTDPPYSAAKAALINFTQCAAKDLASYKVRVNAISPGMVKTTLNRAVWQSWNTRQPEGKQRSYEDWAADKISKVAPLAQWQEPEEIAAMAIYLASPHARNITGQTLNVDGGQVMHA